jgi:hypothetical protein
LIFRGWNWGFGFSPVINLYLGLVDKADHLRNQFVNGGLVAELFILGLVHPRSTHEVNFFL